ncbi:MAG: iron ABC transporter substrate-binding protein [Nitriliruptorales bacterium]|nr:iron ABC transporter substrate-binding protein [Nitriliruptorales bacterium]
MRRALALVSFALVAGLLAGACGSSRDALTIYSGRTGNLVGPLLDQFAEETGTDIDVKYGDSAELALLISEEGDATPADVFYAQNPGAVAFLGDEGLLAELPTDLLEAVPAAFRSEAGRWVGVTGRQRVLVYNRDLIDESDLPSSVFDVTDPRYEGMVGVAPQNGSFQDFVSAMILSEGEERTLEWLDALAANGARTYANNNAIVDAVSRGEIEMGLVNHYYNHRFLAEDPDLPSRNHRFDGTDLGNLVITSSASIVAGTDKPEAAEEFIAFLLSEQAQQYFRQQTFEYPVAAGIDPSDELPAIDTSQLPDVSFDDLGETLRRTTELIAESDLDR